MRPLPHSTILCVPQSRCAARRGYTAIEVLAMAVTVMAIGSAAVITMQKTSMTANLDAPEGRRREHHRAFRSSASSESMQWTLPNREPGGQQPVELPHPGKREQRQRGGSCTRSPGDGKAGNRRDHMSPAFDILEAFDLGLRGVWERPISASTCGSRGSLRRHRGQHAHQADVRVIWPMMILNARCRTSATPTRRSSPTRTTTRGAIRDPGADPDRPVFHAIVDHHPARTWRCNEAPHPTARLRSSS